MKTYLYSFLVLTLLATACSTNEAPIEPVEVDEPVIETPVEVSEMEEYDFLGVLFEYPENLVVSESAWDDTSLFVAETDMSEFEGDGTFMITTAQMRIESISLEDKLASMEELPGFQKSSYTNEAGFTFARVSYYSEFGNFTAVSYLMNVEGGLLTIAQGYSLDEDELAQKIEDFTTILESVHVRILQ